MLRRPALFVTALTVLAIPLAHGDGAPTAEEAAKRYAWTRAEPGYASLADRFPAPAGFSRIEVAKGSYAEYLRHLPLRAKGTPVKSYAGDVLDYATKAAVAVIDLDIGTRDLQQCMDTLIRLRSEYLWSKGTPGAAKFRYGGVSYYSFGDWSAGLRAVKVGKKTTLVKKARADRSRASFVKWLTHMFAQTGTVHSVSEPKVKPADVQIGDFWIHPATPGMLGHTVVVLDIVTNAKGDKLALIGEGYTPAMDMHVIHAPDGGAWFRLDASQAIETPLWSRPFEWSDLRRFKH